MQGRFGKHCSRLSNGFYQRHWRFKRLNSEGVTLCYACEKDGHIERHCLKKGRKDQEVVCFTCGRMGKKARQCHFHTKEEWATVICLRR